jgi:hypothetical protein
MATKHTRAAARRVLCIYRIFLSTIFSSFRRQLAALFFSVNGKSCAERKEKRSLLFDSQCGINMHALFSTTLSGHCDGPEPRELDMQK